VSASGEKVVAGGNTLSELQASWAQLSAIEMEGYGAALAAYQAETTPGLFLVKAICDGRTPKRMISGRNMQQMSRLHLLLLY
jgi:nucleoside phosphorylase